MKKFNFKTLTYTLLMLALVCCGFFCLPQNTSVLAEDGIPAYFSVVQKTASNSEGYNIGNNKAAFVSSSDTVVAKLEVETQDGEVNPIKHISHFVKLNGVAVNNDIQSNYSISIEYNTYRFVLTSTFNDSTKKQPFGKYEITISYIINEGAGEVNKYFSFVYYVVNASDYYNGNNVNTQFNNAILVERQNISQVYDRIYQFNYYSKSLPTLSFNKKNINVVITKTFQKTTTTQRIYFDGTTLVSDNNIVYITESQENNFITITFNDLGVYTIDYYFTYSNEDSIENIDKSEFLNTNVKRKDCLEIFGYQAYYSDSETAELKEFKQIDNGVIDESITDISYLYTTLNESLNDDKQSARRNDILHKLNDTENSLKVQQTNQVPVQFKYNVEIYNSDNSLIDYTQSKLWKILKTKDGYVFETDGSDNIIFSTYDNRPLTESGIYLINLVYKYYPTVLGSDESCNGSNISSNQTEKLRSQWFIFEITKETAKVSITTKTNNNALADEAFTNEDVVISKLEESLSIFNAKTELIVYLQENFSGSYVQEAIINSQEQYTATKNGNYIVTMYFGKNLSRSYSSTFTIDKTDIENVQIFAVNSHENSTYYYRNQEIAFSTNQPVIVSWSTKASNSQVTAEYKFIPLTQSSNITFDSSLLKQYYNSTNLPYSVPTDYVYDFKNIDNELKSVQYQNTQGLTNIPSANVLSQAGMYIFKISDTAGNYKYFAFVIDNSPAKILQQIDGEFVEPSSLNIISSDVTITWGQYKVTRFENLRYSSGEFVIADEWLYEIFNGSDLFEKYFVMMPINTINTFFVKSEINSKVLKFTNDRSEFIEGTKDNNYSDTINLIGSDDELQENDYIYYILDENNTKTLVGYNKDSQENYLANYSQTHRVTISTDASVSQLTYYKNESKTNLYQHSFSVTSSETVNNLSYSKKDKYFIPTTSNALKDSNEILYFQFNASPEAGVVEVEEISYKFTPFVAIKKTDDKNNIAYTYSFFDYSKEEKSVIYSKTNPTQNKATLNSDGLYIWEVNKVYNSLTESFETRAGKYTITRTYANLENTQDKVNNTYDFMIRTLTFIIDRNGIISSPVIVEEGSSKMYSYIGDAIKLQVLEEEGDKMFFEDIYLANSNTSNTPILETNKLPVFVLIPTTKYGYTFVDGSIFYPEDSITYYNSTNKFESKITTFNLSAEIRYSTEYGNLNQSTVIYRSSTESSDNYLRFYEGEGSGRSFKQVGYYKVTIKQGFSNYGVNEFSFVFRITKGSPTFTVNKSSNNEELAQYNNIYYTNQDTVRLSWEDSSNDFMSKIDKSEIYYSVNNGQNIKIDEKLIKTDELNNSIDLNLKDINAYHHGDTINISMQFEGKEEDYNTGEFRTVKTIVIDTIAPTANINKLVGLSGIDSTLVRNVQNKYNTSVSTGLYKYYSFAVDVADLEKVIDFTSHKDGEANIILYRAFKNYDNGEITKYNNIYSQETLPSEIENSIANFTTVSDNINLNDLKIDSTLYNNYIEIVEIDLAGNITVYTIYLSNITNLTNESAIEYKNNNTPTTLSFAQLANNVNIFAKSNFELTKINISDFAWNKITINNVSYLKTPYSGAYYYNLAEYDEANPSKCEVSLDEFGILLPNAQKQNVIIELVPHFNKITLSTSVLNTSLSVMHTSSTAVYLNQEGILIKIPSTSSSSDATIYAREVEIVEYLKDAENNYYENPLYYVLSDTYFASANQQLTSPSYITTSYVNYMGSTYMKIAITSPVANRFYKYSVTDNFGDNYPITNIYGSEKIDKELYSYVDIVETYENSEHYYYSTKNTFFKFNSEKDRIKLTVTTTYTSEVFNLYPNSADIERFNNSGYGKLTTPVKDSVVYIIEMYAPKLDMAEGIVGAEINFTIEKTIAVESISNGYSYDKINLVIYNIIPNITLLGTLNQSQNDLFNKGTMYGNDIKITFKQSTGRIPCTVYLEYEDGTIEQISSGKVVSDPATYTIIIKYLSIFTDSMYDTYLDFTISDNDQDFYKIVYKQNGENVYAVSTGNAFTYYDEVNSKSQSIEMHYILNTNEFEIIYNTDQGITSTSKDPIVINGFTTYIYNLSNSGSDSVSSFFSRTIAITVIPQTNNILKNYSYYENVGTPKPMTDSEDTKISNSFVVTTEESNSSYKRISWQSYYGIQENLVTATIYFGDNQALYTPKTTTVDNTTSITLTASGTYYLTFTDKAGNVHMFNSSVSTYTIRYLRSVIFTVNDESPINNAIYDKEVVINVPKSTSRYYDSNAQPKLYALKNGEEYSPVRDRDNKTYTFSEAGLYKVWFTAAVTDTKTKEVKHINEEPLYFLIIKPSESRYAFDFSEYGNYYVKQIIKNGEDVTEKLTNVNMGNLTYKTEYKDVENNGEITQEAYQKPYLKNFLISINDALTGKGEYTVTIATDNEFNQEFTYSFWINNTAPSIKVSIEENKATTDIISVSFNTLNVLEEVGDCVLKITGMADLYLNKDLLAESEIDSSYNIKLEVARTYYIQLFSESGKLLYSYRVVKNEPLNTVSIIVIVVSSIVVVGLTIMFILLRKRMKIR